MLAPVAHIHPMTIIQRTRMLPVEGQILARDGQRVRANEVIATANLTPKHYILDIASGLGVTQAAAGNYVDRYQNESVNSEDVIARKTGFFNRVIRSPVKGKIVLITGGVVILEEDTEPFELMAGISGNIVEIFPDRGVMIEETGALVQGLWGNGRIDVGILTPLANSSDHVFTPDQVNVSQRGGSSWQAIAGMVTCCAMQPN